MTTAILTWNPLASYSIGGGEIRGLKLIFFKEGSVNLDESDRLISTRTGRKIIKKLELNTTYRASLSAINDFGEGPRSEFVELNTPSGNDMCSFVECLFFVNQHRNLAEQLKCTTEENWRLVLTCFGLKRNDTSRMLKTSWLHGLQCMASHPLNARVCKN